MKGAEAFRVALVTAGSDEEAAKIARALVEERLAACVNIIPGVRSIYRWQGKVEDDREVLMVIKTDADALNDLEERVRAIHSYEVPEVIALRIDQGSGPYLDWLAGNVLPSSE